MHNMATSIHLRLDSSDFISSKKEILLSQRDILGIIMNIREYSKLRKSEFILKNRLKNDFAILNQEIEKLEEILPHDENISVKKVRGEADSDEETLKDSKQKDDVETELEDINRKLSRLSGY